MATDSLISSSYFADLYHSGDGGVIYSINKKISIICCYFHNDYCTENGGCAFVQNGILCINKTLFKSCYSSAKTNGICGNALYIKEKELSFNESTTYLCGPSQTQYSDSSVYTYKAKTIINKYNATTNYGTEGAAGFSIDGLDGTFVKYSMIVDGHDGYMLESTFLYDVNNTNFVNCTSCTRNICYCSGDNLIRFVSCIFWNTGTLGLVCYSRTYTAIDCLSNSNLFSSVTNTGSIHITSLTMNYKCSSKIIRTCNIRRSNHLIKYCRIIIILLISY